MLDGVVTWAEIDLDAIAANWRALDRLASLPALRTTLGAPGGSTG